ncbi:ferredoxin reductase family protein [Mycobacterium sp. Marseille-P9652]|uniref:ferredoxin reductase family protein n=1 Tax=Mycobacterium sp. Marseille-P9652 TaxID=2654950 RepID=UPI0018D0F358|nr:ferredoxin reductase family protein [Mycobacterium sp. Marseille-P9652]
MQTSDETPAQERSLGGGDRWRWAIPLCLAALLGLLVLLWLRAQPLSSRVVDLPTALSALGSLAGLAGTVLLAAAIVLSARLRLIESAAGGLDRAYRLHHRIGSLAFALVALHPTLLAWGYAQFSWKRAARLWSPFNVPATLIAGQVALTLLTVAIVITLYVRVRHQVLIWLQRLLGLAFLPAAYHALYVGGDVSTNPALCRFMQLVIGVGLAALVVHSLLGRWLARHYTFEVSQITMLTGNITEVLLRPVRRPMPFVPGQFGYLRFTHQPIGGEPHPFSIASAPTAPQLRFVIKDVGDYTHQIGGEVRLGARAVVEGAYGRFSHRFVRGHRQVWIAGGIGVAPFLSMAASLRGGGYDVDLFYCYPTQGQAPFLDELLARAATTPGLRVHAVEEDREGLLTAKQIAARIGSLQGREFLLCGPVAMMEALRQQLHHEGVTHARIHVEELAYR